MRVPPVKRGLLDCLAALWGRGTHDPQPANPDPDEPTFANLQRVTTSELGVLMQMKVDLVKSCMGTRSLRDFGGLYLVHGRYLLEPAVALGADFASMIDITPRAEFDDEIAKARLSLPGLDVEFINRDFRDLTLYDTLRPVDTSILFEVLMHQENYISILEHVARKTEHYVCIAQACLKESLLGLPASASLLQFWPEALKDKYRAAWWPKEPQSDRFDTSRWMWGHTVSHLIAVMHGIGWRVEGGQILDTVYGEHWDYALLRFRRDR
jgi:hypothetical protein